MSKLLEAVFDEVEFRLAKRASKRAIKTQRGAIVVRTDDRRSSQPRVENRIMNSPGVGETAESFTSIASVNTLESY